MAMKGSTNIYEGNLHGTIGMDGPHVYTSLTDGCTIVDGGWSVHIQCRLARAKSHTLQERKIRHIHCRVRKTVGVHSATILLSSAKFIW